MGKLSAGVAVRDITPKGEMLQRLNEEGPYYYEGAYRPLFLRVLILTDGEKRFVYASTDLSYFMLNTDFEKALREVNVDPKDFFMSGTRSHNTISKWENIPFDEMLPAKASYGRYVVQTVIELIGEAMANLKPARIGGIVEESNINNYREQYTPLGNFEGMNHNGPRAPWLRVVRVEDLDHNTMAVLANYCMQNCSLYWNTFAGEFSMMTGDVASEIVNYVECAGKHTYPLFWSVGGGADQQAVTYSLMDRVEVDDEGNFSHVHEHLPLDATLQLMRLYACEQGQDILRAMRRIDHYSDEFNYFSEEVVTDVPRRQPVGHPTVFQPGVDHVRPELDPNPVRFRYKLAAVNDIAFCAVNARTFSETYKAVADMMPFGVTVFFDDCFDTVSGVTPPKYEETNLNCHSSLQSSTYTMRMAYNALMAGFQELLTKYMLANAPVYRNAPYPGE